MKNEIHTTNFSFCNVYAKIVCKVEEDEFACQIFSTILKRTWQSKEIHIGLQIKWAQGYLTEDSWLKAQQVNSCGQWTKVE